jgi:phosphopantothenate---cysteine ligase (ATP)
MAESSPDVFFSETEIPAYLKEHEERLNAFIKRCTDEHKRVVVVTSGGTTVPLEVNTVRFIDNFSTGQRGAASVE